jgi:hypothetical protein
MKDQAAPAATEAIANVRSALDQTNRAMAMLLAGTLALRRATKALDGDAAARDFDVRPTGFPVVQGGRPGAP